jgi:hypothetical protein
MREIGSYALPSRARQTAGDAFGWSVCGTLGPMRWAVVVALLVGLTACGDDTRQATVVPMSIDFSNDRRTVTVVTSYPRFVSCVKRPGGLHVKVEGDVAIVTATMEGSTDVHDACTLECGYVTQSLTLDQPLAEGVRFASPPDADPGCGGAIMPQPTTTLAGDS